MQQAFTLDINKCTGCQACEVACTVENELPPGTSWRSVDTFNARHHPGLPVFHLSLACNHCVDAPCMEHCPALAYSKDPATGAVVLNTDSCIGCKYCTWACPYDAPRFDAAAGVVTKCTFCHHRLKEGQRPACVEQCPTGALQISDLDAAPGVATTLGFPDTEAGPSIRFIPLRGEQPFPQATEPPARGPARVAPPSPKTSLRGEWPLAVFTLLTAMMVGVMASPDGRSHLDGVAFLAVAAVGAGLSTMHLGRKLRAYRAVLNWRRSWLSREIILFSLFSGLSAFYLLLGRAPVTGWLAAVVGVAALFSMDRVYHVTRAPGLSRHSAQVLLTGAMVFGVVNGDGTVVLGVGVAKLTLYVERKMRRRRDRQRARGWATIARIGVGWVLPAALWRAGAGVPAAVLVVLGEAIDRCEFYLELEVPTPRGRIAADLSAEIERVETRAITAGA